MNTSTEHPYTQGTGNAMEEQAEGMQEAEDWELSCEIVSPRNGQKLHP